MDLDIHSPRRLHEVVLSWCFNRVLKRREQNYFIAWSNVLDVVYRMSLKGMDKFRGMFRRTRQQNIDINVAFMGYWWSNTAQARAVTWCSCVHRGCWRTFGRPAWLLHWHAGSHYWAFLAYEVPYLLEDLPLTSQQECGTCVTVPRNISARLCQLIHMPRRIHSVAFKPTRLQSAELLPLALVEVSGLPHLSASHLPEKLPGFHWIGDLSCPRTRLSDMEKCRLLAVLRLEIQNYNSRNTGAESRTLTQWCNAYSELHILDSPVIWLVIMGVQLLAAVKLYNFQDWDFKQATAIYVNSILIDSYVFCQWTCYYRCYNALGGTGEEY
jgi:hypothetical protein